MAEQQMPVIPVGEQQKLLMTMKPVEAKPTDNLDLSVLHKKAVKIEKVEVVLSNRGYVNNKLVELEKPVEQIMVASENLAHLVVGAKPGVEIRARIWLNCIKNADGSLGWSTHEKSNMRKFLKGHGANNPLELIGKECTVKVEDEVGDDGVKFFKLRFLY